jgi:hypothetical protein
MIRLTLRPLVMYYLSSSLIFGFYVTHLTL